MANILNGVAGLGHLYSRAAVLRLLGWHRRAARQALAESHVDAPKAVAEDDCGRHAPRIHHESVQRIRESIAAGDYLTSERIDGTVEQIQKLFGHWYGAPRGSLRIG